MTPKSQHPRFALAPLLAALISLPSAAWSAAPTAADFAPTAEQLLADTVPNADGPGTVVVVKRGNEELYRGARGMASVELGVPLAPDQVFRIGSVTKQIAAAGLLKLVEDGKVALDDPLSKFLPDYPNGDAVTITQLLNHTSGIKSYTGIPGYMDQEIKRDLDTEELVAVFRDEEPDFAPGEGWSYNNSGYVLVGAVIEAASGMPWGDWLAQSLYQPLGLERIQDGATDAVIPGHTEGYAMAPDGSFTVAASLSMTQPHAAGALVSTADDLVRWNEGLHGGEVLPAELYQRMITPEGEAVDEGYGYGIGASSLRGRDAYAHGGGINGFLSYLLYVPEEELSVVVFRNAAGPGASPGLVARRMAAAAIGDPYPAPEPIDVAQADLEAVEGVYRGDEDNARVLRVVDGVLTSQRTGGGRFELIPIAPDTFLFEDSLSYFVIERNDEGAPAAMRFYADGEGEGDAWPLTDEPLPARPDIELSREQQERLLGEYANPQINFRVFFDDADVLRVQVPGQPAFELRAETPSLLYIAEVGADLEFAPAEGTAQAVVLTQGPARLELERVAETP